MNSLWGALAPLIIGSAVVPIQIIMTILLLRSSAGRVAAVAWVAGMTVARLVQGVVFGLLLSRDTAATTTGDDQPYPLTSTLLLVVGLLLLVMALRSLLKHPDGDDPPPRWLTMTATMGPGKAFGVGAALIAVGAKFWVFTLAAISAIGDADLGRTESVLVFVLFVVLAESVIIGVLAIAFVAPGRSDALLTKASAWLEAHNRAIMVVVGVVFGLWFSVQGLTGLDLL